MYPKIQHFIEARIKEFHLIPEDRKQVLKGISDFVQKKQNENQPVQLVYICIHNSRRSHFGHIAAAVSASHFQLKIRAYSGGTIATAFNTNAVHALEQIGFLIKKEDQSLNPHFKVYFDSQNPIDCFSKIYDDPANPSEHFAAIMTCSEAEENCPFIPNAEFKTSTPYEDPKMSDGTGKESEVYTDRFSQILRETLYAFSLIKK